MDNITILLQQSKCKREDIDRLGQKLPAPKVLAAAAVDPTPQPTPALPDPTEVTVKAAISNTVAEQFRRVGRPVSGEELSRIVDAEYLRVKDKLPLGVMSQQQQEENEQQKQQPSSSSSSSSGALSNLNVDWSSLQNAVSSVKLPTPVATDLKPTPAAPSPPPAPISSNDSSSNKPTSELKECSDFDDLTLDDLTALFKNFKDLDRDNQKSLIDYMKRLEKTNPAKVTELKQHIHGNKGK
jgi:hypothetical protein